MQSDAHKASHENGSGEEGVTELCGLRKSKERTPPPPKQLLIQLALSPAPEWERR